MKSADEGLMRRGGGRDTGNRCGGGEVAIEDRAALHRQVARHTSASTATTEI